MALQVQSKRKYTMTLINCDCEVQYFFTLLDCTKNKVKKWILEQKSQENH